jgi:hypothetical protein
MSEEKGKICEYTGKIQINNACTCVSNVVNFDGVLKFPTKTHTVMDYNGKRIHRVG